MFKMSGFIGLSEVRILILDCLILSFIVAVPFKCQNEHIPVA